MSRTNTRSERPERRQSMRLAASPHEGAVLPKSVADPDAPPAVHALRDGGSYPIGGDQQRWQKRARRLGPRGALG
ncbi:MAG: hypothetical protein WDN04_07105 [Rhodospirillales bacterium]